MRHLFFFSLVTITIQFFCLNVKAQNCIQKASFFVIEIELYSRYSNYFGIGYYVFMDKDETNLSTFMNVTNLYRVECLCDADSLKKHFKAKIYNSNKSKIFKGKFEKSNGYSYSYEIKILKVEAIFCESSITMGWSKNIEMPAVGKLIWLLKINKKYPKKYINKKHWGRLIPIILEKVT